MTAPSVGRRVHYVSYGTPGGEYTSQCRAAVVTDVSPGLLPEAPPAGTAREIDSDAAVVGLCVLNPTGMFFNHGVIQDEAEKRGGTWHWPERVE